MMDLESHIKKIGQLNKDSEVLSSSALADLSSISTTFLSSVGGDPLSASGGRLSQLNIIKFDSLSAYNLCSDIVGLSDIALIDEDQINAEGERIISVGDPVELDDAANKAYVDSKLSGVLSDEVLTAFCNAVSSDGLSAVEVNLVISAFYNLLTALGCK